MKRNSLVVFAAAAMALLPLSALAARINCLTTFIVCNPGWTSYSNLQIKGPWGRFSTSHNLKPGQSFSYKNTLGVWPSTPCGHYTLHANIGTCPGPQKPCVLSNIKSSPYNLSGKPPRAIVFFRLPAFASTTRAKTSAFFSDPKNWQGRCP